MTASEELPDSIREKLMNALKIEEAKTDLDNLIVLSTVGLKVASSTSFELDADTTSASSTALIDLGVRLSDATQHGLLKEILLHNAAGYSILMAINENYIVFGGLSAAYRIGYYLGYLRELSKKLNIILSGGEITEISLLQQEEEIQKIEQKKVEEEAQAISNVMPSVADDKAAMDELLNYLDDWDEEEKEAMGIQDVEELETNNIISIPESIKVGLQDGNETISIPEATLDEIEQDITIEFKLYKDEVPPIPLEDYTPMDVDEQAPQEAAPEPVKEEPMREEPVKEELPPLDQLPSLDALTPPDFESEFAAAPEYNTEFILKEESEALDSVLKDLGWDEED
jgi:predicted regulator of Ras-like GTPase activity (Roadblock/LC7/MglB family)